MSIPQRSPKNERFTLVQAIGFIILIIAVASAAFALLVIIGPVFWSLGDGPASWRIVVSLWTNLVGHSLLIGAGLKLLRRKDRAIPLYIVGLGILTFSVAVSPFSDVGIYLPLDSHAVLIYVILGIGLLLGKRIEMVYTRRRI
jgi:hypothetical protein